MGISNDRGVSSFKARQSRGLLGPVTSWKNGIFGSTTLRTVRRVQQFSDNWIKAGAVRNFVRLSTVFIIVMHLFRRVSQNCEKRLLASSCLPVRMEKLVSHWTDFHEI